MWRAVAAVAGLAIVSAGTGPVQAQGFTEVDRVTLQDLDPTTNDGHFGTALALTSTHAFVAAPQKTGGGTVYQFRVLEGGQLQLQHPLQTEETTSGFGARMAADGDWLAVGETDVRLYRRNGEDWSLVQTIRRDDIAEPPGIDIRGLRSALALDGDVLVIGDDTANVTAAGTSVSNAGVLIVFRRNGASWQLEQVVPHPAPINTSRFGTAVSVHGATLLAGARNSAEERAGRAYVFERTAAGWTHVRTLSNPADEGTADFGWSVALSGTTALVGCRLCNTSIDGITNSGSFFAFDRDLGGAGNWGLRGEYISDAAAYIDEFSYAMKLRGDLLLTSSPGNGDKLVFFFQRGAGGHWQQVASVQNNEGFNTDFGAAVDFLDGKALVGADRYPDQPPAPNRYGAVYAYRNALLAECIGGFDAIFCSGFEESTQ